MNISRERSMNRPRILISEKRIAFIRLVNQLFPKANRFMAVFKIIAMIMIHHRQAA
jgi:hypothetical protein